jgi:uncharacterized damage-inducible protein DinB
MFALQNTHHMKKSELLEQLMQTTEAHLQLAIHDWQMLSHEQFSATPAAGSWSANQCLQHLNGYGHYYIPRLDSALAKALPQPAAAAFKPGWLGGWFTNLMKPDSQTGLPVKKMKTPATYYPGTQLPAHEVIATFIEQQEMLLQLLQVAMQKNLASPRITISISKLVTLQPGDVFAFLIAHNERHVQQAIRALATVAGNQPIMHKA